MPGPVFGQNTLSDSNTYFVGTISLEGNKISKERIIVRELLIKSGDTLSGAEMDILIRKSRENLLNTSLFNFVSIETRQSGPGEIMDIKVLLTERWYIWPWPIIEFADRNFNTWWKENRDLSRMSYGAVLKWNNFRGRKELLQFTAKFGYNELYGFDYTIPYLNKKETLGLGVGLSFGRTREVSVKHVENQLIYYKDDNQYVMNGIGSFLSLIYRREIYNTHTFRFEYDYRNFADTLLVINPEFSIDGLTTLQFLSFVYQFKHDHRDYKPYPLKGHYFDLEVAKRGLGILENGGLDVFYVLTTFRMFFQLGNRWYYASGLNSKFSNDADQPFLIQRAIGYGRDIVRGYEYYVVNGNNFGIFKNNLKFALLPQRDYNIDFIKSEKFKRVYYAFYLNAFVDMGFADNFNPQSELINSLENSLLVAYGLGLDFVTYYDLVFRFEFSFNRMNEHGFYVHFTAPI